MIQTKDYEDPWDIAERRAKRDAEGDYRIQPPYPVPARWEFAGVRKVVEVRHEATSDELGSGDELTYNSLLFDDEAAIARFVADEECAVRYSS